MLPIVDKPVIQYIIEGAVASGIEEIVLITATAKRAIEDHFDRFFELEYRLEASGKLALLAGMCPPRGDGKVRDGSSGRAAREWPRGAARQGGDRRRAVCDALGRRHGAGFAAV